MRIKILVIVLTIPLLFSYPSISQEMIKSDSAKVLLLDTLGLLFEMEFETPQGKAFRFSNTNEKVVLVDFWATWCKGCIQAQPDVELLVQKLGKKKIDIVYVSIDDEKEKWKKYTKAIMWRGEHIIIDRNKHAQFYNLLLVNLGTNGKLISGTVIPQYYLISKSGKLLETKGPDDPQMEADLIKLINE